MSLPAVEVSQTPEEKFREFLSSRSKPQRYTEQQRDLVNHIFSHHDHFDTEQLIDDLRDAKLRVSRATVYRTLTKLVDAGLLRRLEIGSRTFYEHDYGYPQHDHLVCERCHKMIEFQNPAIEALLRETAAANLFQMNGHSLIIRGICQECNKARSAKRRHDLI
ncbi:Fur family transcriptional regulator [Tuwongella immobilis]|uniref:Ferric uptake regulation protein n=1 Tax=Tuwongella immobilis TaxID=692036 RepID=A0A6C2YMC3_9BACT|nr:Fur family transcriptional regulator [Tuwongella immobilis]VIP02514.1 fur family transcriptional regulator : Ferric-uptake regulator OS=Rhodopirellula maiorica SM1 GN=RMSM_06093 PE=4 SV=1: FUR [Tuwongella immobilis]VTS01631.1 fur family transcriptional regulator : Ferric-uptake regulator OS=Rhodopirellula maiorica SM1 GN=RMSM_06093 PE=4 SV=1: FUR [Tuwongella immobilis]